MFRAIAKNGIAASIHWTGLGRLIGSRRGLSGAPLVLCYHRVVEDFRTSVQHSIAPMLVSTRTFEKQLDWIGKRYDFISADQLADIAEGRSAPRKPVAAITFDDGYADVYRHAFPVLRRKGIPSANFVVTDLIGTRRLQLHDELYFLISMALRQWQTKQRRSMQDFARNLEMDASTSTRLCNYAPDPAVLNDAFKITRVFLEALSQAELGTTISALRARLKISDEVLNGFISQDWDMLREMSRNDVTIGSHTRSHALLVNESKATIRAEITGSKQVLEQHLGIPIHHFAYPDGRFDRAAVEGVVAAGFRSAYTICMHQDPLHPLFTISRRVLWENSSMAGFGGFSSAIMSCMVNGIFEPAFKCQQVHSA